LLTKVFITVDVECGEYSPDYEGAVWGRIGNFQCKEYGLSLILDLLKQVNLKAVFFLEALSSFRHGISNLKKISDRILSEGHEIQLHLHPSLRHPVRQPDAEIHLGKYPLNEQVALIETGIDVLKKCGVEKISAFRAGGFGMSMDTFHALEKCGLLYDSSYNLCYLNSSCQLGHIKPIHNDVFLYKNILEFPVTCFRNPLSKKIPFRHLQITASSYGEIKKTLLLASNEKMKTVNILLHSFEFIKFLDKERTVGKPNYIIIKRFTDLLEFLSSKMELFDVVGFNDLSDVSIASMKQLKAQTDFIPELPLHMKIGRQIEQIMARI
jgi:peptidoglycan/xylan/chitin deacetylase (PgdA/CDA1 family)